MGEDVNIHHEHGSPSLIVNVRDIAEARSLCLYLSEQTHGMSATLYAVKQYVMTLQLVMACAILLSFGALTVCLVAKLNGVSGILVSMIGVFLSSFIVARYVGRTIVQGVKSTMDGVSVPNCVRRAMIQEESDGNE